MEKNTEAREISQIDACRRAKTSGNLEEAIRSLIRVHTHSEADGSIAVLWGALPEDDPASYALYREAWAKVVDALRNGAFCETPAPTKAAAE
jgi:hypothetical protein